jgi:hypothetical protein
MRRKIVSVLPRSFFPSLAVNLSLILFHFLFIGVRTIKLVQIYTNFCVLTTIKKEWREYGEAILHLGVFCVEIAPNPSSWVDLTPHPRPLSPNLPRTTASRMT